MENKNTIVQKNTFPKAEKLKSRKAIDGLFKGGKSFFIHPYKVFYQMADDGWQMAASKVRDTDFENNGKLPAGIRQPPSIIRHPPTAIQVGFAVSTKNFKHAVDRNRIKRLGREGYRLNKHLLVSHLANRQVQLQVFFVFTNKSLPTFVNVQSAMQACLRKLIKIIKKDEGLLQG